MLGVTSHYGRQGEDHRQEKQTRLPWRPESGEHAFSRASVLKTHLRCHQMVQIQEAHLTPHLELLPQLQVHVVNLGDGNVVVLPLLLAQQLVPATLKNGHIYLVV